MSDEDVRYFQKRVVEERNFASLASDENARRSHEFIATRYERLLTSQNTPTLLWVSQ